MTHMAINRFRQLAYGQKQANWDPAMLAAAKEVKEEEDRLNAAAVGMRPDGSKASPQEVEDALAQRSYVAPAGRTWKRPATGLVVGGGVAVGGLSAILAALLSKKETMLRNAVIAGAVGNAAGMSGVVYGSLAKGALAERKRRLAERKRRLATGGLDKHEDLN